MATVAQARELAAPQHIGPIIGPEDFTTDIPFHVAEVAFGGGIAGRNKAKAEIATYAARLASDRGELTALADTDDKYKVVDEEFTRYRAGARIRTLAYLIGMSKAAAELVGGFPKQRTDRGAANNLRAAEIEDYRVRALSAIRAKLRSRPSPRPAHDVDLIAHLRAQLDVADRNQERMKAVNVAIRTHANRDAQMRALADLGIEAVDASALLVPDYMKRVGYKDSTLKNNFAEILRLRRRIDGLVAARAQGMTEQRGPWGRIELSPTEARVRIYLPSNMDKAERAALNAAGFHWAGSIACWQGPHNDASIAYARKRIGG